MTSLPKLLEVRFAGTEVWGGGALGTILVNSQSVSVWSRKDRWGGEEGGGERSEVVLPTPWMGVTGPSPLTRLFLYSKEETPQRRHPRKTIGTFKPQSTLYFKPLATPRT